MNLSKFIFVLLPLLIITSCTVDNSGDIVTNRDGQFFASVDGELFTASGARANARFSGGSLSIDGTNSGGNIIFLTIPTFQGEGSYDLSTSASIGTGAYFAVGDDTTYLSIADGGSGSITITEFNSLEGYVSGTFNFTAIQENIDINTQEITTETVVISSGSFTDLNLQGILTEGNTNNTLEAIIDDVAFSANNVAAFDSEMNGVISKTIIANNTNTNQNITITLNGAIAIGTYDLSSTTSSANSTALYTPDITSGGSSYVAQSGGTVTIDSYDDVAGSMSGTFQFVAEDILQQTTETYTITEGSFSVTFQ
ncbi:DUF6252 family protein [Dokdonia sp. Hel_I_53]|uniref:DUF6252 family protein n=1 Tax=Dokdonia sp. Hel_I_53 TaxID=1566287 RepID=UPI00119A8DBF|nr:DUF6252 family protein [Dokdonia sp. Hel_I_53]TVZ51962.1 hypothetical protein OD90_1124 [Dokdonia sp. Hel_I_53]